VQVVEAATGGGVPLTWAARYCVKSSTLMRSVSGSKGSCSASSGAGRWAGRGGAVGGDASAQRGAEQEEGRVRRLIARRSLVSRSCRIASSKALI
jgi:hypothetical protein